MWASVCRDRAGVARGVRPGARRAQIQTSVADGVQMDVAIYVSATGTAAALEQCLVCLGELDEHPAHRVVIVDNATTGFEALFARLGGDIELVRLANPVSEAVALATALHTAPAEVVVYLRDAARVAPGWLGALVAPLATAECVATTSITGGQHTHPVQALALAWKATALDGVPDIPADHLVAALVANLGSVGRVAGADGALVVPALAGVGGPEIAPYGSVPLLSVVIPTLDAASPRLRDCVAAIHANTGVPHEIVIVDNFAPPQGFSAPVNTGLRGARGDYLVVCNDDVEVLPGWWPPLQETLDDGATVAYPRTVDTAEHEGFSAWCFALTRESMVEHSVAPGAFFDPDMVVWFQDSDLMVRLQRAGSPPRRVAESRIRHGRSLSVNTPDPRLREWIVEQIERDRCSFEAKTGLIAVEGTA